MVNIFVVILNMSVTASLVAVVLLCLRGILLRQLPATFCYLLWGTVLFRLLVPWSLSHNVSIFNLMRQSPTTPDTGSYAVTMEYVEPLDGYWRVRPPDNYNVFLVLATVWLTVVLLAMLYSVVTYWVAVHRTRTAFVVHAAELLTHCKQLVGVRQSVSIYRSSSFDSPVVVGILHPRIILPDRVDLDERALLHIITHELTHIKRLDHISKILLSTAFVIHWFNPLLWLCAGLIRKDIERACDERVLAVLGEGEHVGYASSLLRLCSAQHRLLGYAPLAFGESAIKKRVHGALNYKRLSPLRTALLSLLVVLVGLVTSTNAVAVTDGYRPVHNRQVSTAVEQRYDAAARELSRCLTTGDTAALLALSGRTDPHYLASLEQLQRKPLTVEGYKLFPQDDNLAYCYLRLVDGKEYVAELAMRDIGVQLVRVRQEEAFAAAMTVPASSEPVRFVRNMHRFGIYSGMGNGEGLPRPAVAALCIDEEYRDRVRRGEHDPDEQYLPPEWVVQAAREYFNISEFSYTFDDELYSDEHGMYIYSTDRGEAPRADIVGERHEGGNTIVTAQLYRDPLFLYPEQTISYTLRLK